MSSTVLILLAIWLIACGAWMVFPLDRTVQVIVGILGIVAGIWLITA